MNNNPIVSDTKLVHIQIDFDSILDRKDTYDITFSLVANEQPKGFNLYYGKVSEVSDKTKWTVIEKNVLRSSLNPTLYDTGYIDNTGKPIVGEKYTYIWTLAKTNLTNIQIIIEPIY